MIRLYLWFCRVLFVARGPWVVCRVWRQLGGGSPLSSLMTAKD